MMICWLISYFICMLCSAIISGWIFGSYDQIPIGERKLVVTIIALGPLSLAIYIGGAALYVLYTLLRLAYEHGAD